MSEARAVHRRSEPDDGRVLAGEIGPERVGLAWDTSGETVREGAIRLVGVVHRADIHLLDGWVTKGSPDRAARREPRGHPEDTRFNRSFSLSVSTS